MKIRRLNSAGFAALSVCVLTSNALAQNNEGNMEKTNAPPGKAKASAGLLPVPDYSADFWTREYLTGDWGGVRTSLADHGVQLGMLWDQYVQGVADGGRERKTEYGGTVDYTVNLDLMKMNVLPGALVKFRAESRYGRSVNGVSGTILPVNSDALFPLTAKSDEDVPFTITDLNYTQFLSEHLGVLVGKLDTLDSDLNEFASGRGTHQFMNANFLFSPAVALRLPYSTLGAGVIWMPVPPGPKGGVTVSSWVVNTADSSTTTGFDDFDKGQTWITEADFQYRLGCLPGGMNVGGLWSFNQHFTELNSRLVFQPGQGLSVPAKHSTWAVYWSDWQYLYTEPPANKPIDLLNGQPDQQGVGLFARFGFADKETNPIEWAASGGVGGRGLIPSRDNDTFGLGYYYNSIQTLRLSNILGIKDSTQGFECFYNIAITPACHVTLDLQVVESIQSSVRTATVLGLRASLNF
jgi:porin